MSYRVRDELLEQALELGGVHGQGDRLAGEPTVDHGVGQLLCAAGQQQVVRDQRQSEARQR